VNENEPVQEIPDSELINKEFDRMEQDVRGGAVELPVDLSLLKDVPKHLRDEAYAVPDADAMGAAAELEKQTAEQVATVRDEQSLRIANMGQDGVNHFLVNIEGQELCGSCGTAFPCGKWTSEIDPRNTAESSGRPVPNEDKAHMVAELLGVSLDRGRQIVLMSTPLDELVEQAGIYPKL
jgi:hypothetical protein